MTDNSRDPAETLSLKKNGSPLPQVSTIATSGNGSSQQSDLPACIDRYRVIEVLGKGGFGVVYLAHDHQLQRNVAIKVPRLELTSQPAGTEAYLAEARMLANLDHPHIVPVHDVGSSDDFPCFIVSKYIDGIDLAHRMKISSVPLAEAVELVAAVADALHYAHLQGVVHRDLKPANILLDSKAQPFVADFGLAIHENRERDHAGEVSGTPAYMAPEQVLGQAHRLDGRTDIYSLGVILYEMLTGRVPFRATTREDLFDQILHRDPKPLLQINDQIPEMLEKATLTCLAKRPVDRYATALDLAAVLRQWRQPCETSPTDVAESSRTSQARRSLQARAAMTAPGCSVTLELALLFLIIAIPGGVLGVRHGWPRIKAHFNHGMLDLEEGPGSSLEPFDSPKAIPDAERKEGKNQLEEVDSNATDL